MLFRNAFATTCFALLLTGCADGLVGDSESDLFVDRGLTEASEGKVRNAHLFASASKVASKGEPTTGLVFAVDPYRIVDRYRVLERYKVLERYALMERFEYEDIFSGYAVSASSEALQALLAAMQSDPDILWVEPDFGFTSPDSSPQSGGSSQLIPPSITQVGATESYTRSGDGQGSVDIDIYIVDSGVSSPDINVVEAIDFTGSGSAEDEDGHGTHIAGIAAAVDDTDGVVGVAPGARVHNLKVFGADGGSDVSVVLAALDHIAAQAASQKGVRRIVNLSLGEDIGTEDYTALDEAVDYLTSLNVVVVVAAGNKGEDSRFVTPAHATSAITVGSIDPYGKWSAFSNHGNRVDVAAPGEMIFSLAPGGNDVAMMNGTSMAAAHVTGAAALLLTVMPDLSPEMVGMYMMKLKNGDATSAPANTKSNKLWVGHLTQAPAGVAVPTTPTIAIPPVVAVTPAAPTPSAYKGLQAADSFSTASFSGSDGTEAWASDWDELGESNGPSRGQVRVVASNKCASGMCFRGRGAGSVGSGVSRAVDLSGATQAGLTFSARTNKLSGQFTLDISPDGGSTWTVLKSFDTGTTNQSAEAFDISGHISSNTVIRFSLVDPGNKGFLYVDDIQIQAR